MRLAAVSRLDTATAELILRAWPSLAYLDGVPSPSGSDLDLVVTGRTGGASLERFVGEKRREAESHMLRAQHLRVRQLTEDAISSAYESDLASTESYLVESAIAVGDRRLLTVIARWELAVAALAGIPSLPNDFSAAVDLVRTTIANALGPGDGDRISTAFVPLG